MSSDHPLIQHHLNSLVFHKKMAEGGYGNPTEGPHAPGKGSVLGVPVSYYREVMAEKKKTSLVYGQDDEEISLEKAKEDLRKRGVEPEETKSFSKSIINVLNGQGHIERLAFEADPSQVNNYAGVYKSKIRLIPDTILKRIAIQDSLVSNIVRARQNHISSFGRPRPDRFSFGIHYQAQYRSVR